MIDEEVARVIVAEVTSLSSAGRIYDGERLFLENVDQLPEALRLECLGNLYFYKRDLQTAVDHYEAAIVLAPERVISRYQYLVGTQEERKGDFVAAFKRYQAAVDAEPTFLDAYVELGGLLAKIKDYEGAAKCYRDAASIAPHDASVIYNLRAVLSQLAVKDPDRYNKQLKDVEVAYEKLAQAYGAEPIQGHSW